MPEILTERLKLRAFRPGDLLRLLEAMQDWSVQQWLDTPPWPYGEADGRAWIDYVARDHAEGRPQHFAIAAGDDDRLLGCVSFEQTGGLPALGYWLHPEAWGRGYAAEAARALTEQACEVLDYPAVCARTDPDNLASQRVLEKLGFRPDGSDPVRTRRGSGHALRFRLDFAEES